MTIKEKIEALKKNDFDDKQKAIQFAFEGYNQAIDDVLDIIQAEFAEKDAPDCEGWWWYKKDENITPCKLFYDVYGEIMFPNGTKYCNGKWIKAIVPTGEGE